MVRMPDGKYYAVYVPAFETATAFSLPDMARVLFYGELKGRRFPPDAIDPCSGIDLESAKEGDWAVFKSRTEALAARAVLASKAIAECGAMFQRFTEYM